MTDIIDRHGARPIRVMVFEARPDAILLQVSQDALETLRLPPLPVPFERVAVAKALGDAGVPARVISSVPGRWTEAIRHARQVEKSEFGQRQKLREASDAALFRGSLEPELHERGKLIERKHAVEAEIVSVKARIGDAKSRSHFGQFMPAREFRGLEQRLDTLRVDYQAITARLGELKASEKARNIARHSDFKDRFINMAKELLDEETFQELMAAANEDGDEENI